MTKRPIIGIITAKVADEAQRQLLRGILHKIREVGAEAVVISNIYNFHEYFAGTEVENKIYDLISSPRFDGLILTAETIWYEPLQQEIYRRIVESKLPVVVTGANIEGLDCLNNDVSSDFEDIAEHLVKVHHFTEFDFLTGFEGNATSYERVEGFRRVLAHHGLTLPEENVIYGDFWNTSGEALANEYISGKRRMPQAVVCANDFMAYGICDVLLENDVSVPDDIAVIGYEYVGERFYHSPILTTYLRNREAIGAWAVTRLMSKITGEPEPPVNIRGQMICGDTCPCGVNKAQLTYELKSVRRTQYYTNLNYEGNFEQQLTLCRSISDYIKTMQEFAYLVRDMVGLYLCLYENWASIDDPIMAETDSQRAPMLCYRIISQNQPSADEPLFFLREQICPDTLPGLGEDGFF
ncbi:MAG: LacI family DNA-binding transcriptional regulator, partial [Oscillospiraceae bacterium]|nr:LacI family DNA-binding transcriptional regulator [Oscillospiraceae bacterium]